MSRVYKWNSRKSRKKKQEAISTNKESKYKTVKRKIRYFCPKRGWVEEEVKVKVYPAIKPADPACGISENSIQKQLIEGGLDYGYDIDDEDNMYGAGLNDELFDDELDDEYDDEYEDF